MLLQDAVSWNSSMLLMANATWLLTEHVKTSLAHQAPGKYSCAQGKQGMECAICLMSPIKLSPESGTKVRAAKSHLKKKK